MYSCNRYIIRPWHVTCPPMILTTIEACRPAGIAGTAILFTCLVVSQVPATHLKIGHPKMGARSLIGLQ